MMDKVVDNVTQDVKITVKDVLLQRDQERKEKLKNIREEKELSSPDQVKVFHSSFDEHSRQITESINLIEEGRVEHKDLPEHFSKIGKDIQVLNRYLSVSTVFLTNYIVRKCLQTIEEMENRVKALEDEVLPKKKFGFKARKTKVLDKPSKKVDEVDASPKLITYTTISCGFSNKKDENLKLSDDVVSKNDVELRNLDNCTVFLCGSPSTVHISSVTRCTILCGPVSTSVFVENCHNSDLVIACQQLRIHSTKDSRFYIHVTSRAIIEDSSSVQFAPYNLSYDGIQDHFDASGLDWGQNHWQHIDDFNWLVADVPSPNWKEISENERVKCWAL